MGPSVVVEARLEQSVFLGASHQFVCRIANGAIITAAPTGGGAEKLSGVASGEPSALPTAATRRT